MATRTPPLQPRSRVHAYWGSYASSSLLPNASGNPISGGVFAALEAGDDAYVPTGGSGHRWTCTNPGTDGGGDATWTQGAGGGSGTTTQERSYVPVGAGNNQNTNIGLDSVGGSGASARTFDPTSAVHLERQLRNGGTILRGIDQ